MLCTPPAALYLDVCSEARPFQDSLAAKLALIVGILLHRSTAVAQMARTRIKVELRSDSIMPAVRTRVPSTLCSRGMTAAPTLQSQMNPPAYGTLEGTSVLSGLTGPNVLCASFDANLGKFSQC